MISLVYGGLLLLTIFCVAVMLGWLSWALRRAGFSARKNKIVGLAALTLTLWLLFTAYLARGGLLVTDSWPPRVPLIPLTALLALVLMNRAAIFTPLLKVTPRHWPVLMQSFRIFVELAFWGLFAAGAAPALVTFEGRNFDVVVGVTAPLIALAIAKFNLRPRWVLLWNILGLVILLNTVFTTLTDSPGVLHLAWGAEPFTAFAQWPFVWIPSFLAPLAIFLHVFSIRQNLKETSHE